MAPAEDPTRDRASAHGSAPVTGQSKLLEPDARQHSRTVDRSRLRHTIAVTAATNGAKAVIAPAVRPTAIGQEARGRQPGHHRDRLLACWHPCKIDELGA